MSNLQKLNAYVLVPLFNLPSLFLCDPLYENMTHIAYAKHHFFYVLLWSISCALTLLVSTKQLMRLLEYKKKSVDFLLTLVCALMIISVCIPYDHVSLTWIHKLHVRLAMIATIGYILLFFFLLVKNYTLHYTIIAPLFRYYSVMIACLSFLFLVLGSVSLLVEISFVMGMSILLYEANKKAAHIYAAKS